MDMKLWNQIFSDEDNSGSTLSDSESRTLESLSVQLQEAELMQFVLIYLNCYLVAQSEKKVGNQRYELAFHFHTGSGNMNHKYHIHFVLYRQAFLPGLFWKSDNMAQ